MNLTDILTHPSEWYLVVLPLIFAALILFAGHMLGRFGQSLVRSWVPRAGTNAATIAPILGQTVRYAAFIVALIMAMNVIGIPTASVLTVLGTAGLALALALQNTLSNVAAGIMLAWNRPIAVGEYITGDGVEGEVVEIGLFSTRLRSTSGLYVFTTNNRLWNGAITNYSRELRRRVDVMVTIPDSADIGAVRRVLIGIAGRDKRVLSEPAPTVFVDSFGTSTVTLEMRTWVKTPDYRPALRGLTEQAKLAINRLLAERGGGMAEVAQAPDPHLAQAGNIPAAPEAE